MPPLPAGEESSTLPGEAGGWGKPMRAGVFSLCAVVLLPGAGTAQADEWVPGYTAANGAYVPGHWESDGNAANNYLNLQNVNPYAPRPRPQPQNYGAYVDPSDDATDMGDGEQGDLGGLGDEDGGAGDGGAGGAD